MTYKDFAFPPTRRTSYGKNSTTPSKEEYQFKKWLMSFDRCALDCPS